LPVVGIVASLERPHEGPLPRASHRFPDGPYLAISNEVTVSVVAWIAFGMIAGYTVGGFVAVDEALGTSGHVALGSMAAVVAGLIGSATFGVNPLSPRIDMLSVVVRPGRGDRRDCRLEQQARTAGEATRLLIPFRAGPFFEPPT
jgi:hypothetical protein